MKIKIVLLVTILLIIGSAGFAQTAAKPDYIGNWSTERAFALSLTRTTITFQGKPPNRPEKAVNYIALPGPAAAVYALQITSPLGANSYLSPYLTIEIDKETKPTKMTVTFYKSLADLKAGKNPFVSEGWTRDGEGALTVEQLATSLAQSFTAKELGKFDSMLPYKGTVKIVIEHSISGKIETRIFKDFAQVERWLKKRGTSDGPSRNSGPLLHCRKGVCAYEQTGLLHNNLYLQKITYGLINGLPTIKAVYVLDGD